MHTISRSRSREAAACFLSVVFSGYVTLDERRAVFGAAVDAAIAADIRNILIDFTHADIASYPAIDGVKYAWHAAQLTFLDKIAYVAPGHEGDLAISLLRKSFDIDVRLFGSREAASAWLAEVEGPTNAPTVWG